MSAAYVQLRGDQTGKKVQTVENTIGSNVVEAQTISAIDGTGLTDSYVQVAADSTGKKMRTFLNTISGHSVHALAVTPVDPSGSPLL